MVQTTENCRILESLFHATYTDVLRASVKLATSCAAIPKPCITSPQMLIQITVGNGMNGAGPIREKPIITRMHPATVATWRIPYLFYLYQRLHTHMMRSKSESNSSQGELNTCTREEPQTWLIFTKLPWDANTCRKSNPTPARLMHTSRHWWRTSAPARRGSS